jgi:hypothetical protein
MGLDFAIDELYATGWTSLDSAGCKHHADGRAYPGLDTVKAQFSEAGFDLTIRHVQLFDCYRAEWRDGAGAASGAVVGRSDAEAAVYALSQLRRRLMATVS